MKTKLALIVAVAILSGCSGGNYADSPGASIVTKYVEIDGRTYLAQQLPLGVSDGISWHSYAMRWVIVAGPIPPK